MSLSREQLEQLAGAAILAEVAQRFAGTDPVEMVKTHAGRVYDQAEVLGIDENLLDEDVEKALAALIDVAQAQVEVTFPRVE